MISRLEIKGFKSLVDVSIELGAVNVFIGANGSGKSNLLEAVGLLSAVIHGGLEEESIRFRGVRIGSPASFCSSLKKREKRPLSISASDDRIRYSVEAEPDERHPSQWCISKESGEVDGSPFFSRTGDRYSVLRTNDGRTIEIDIRPQMRIESFATAALVLSSIPNTDRPMRNSEPPDAPEDRQPDREPTLFDEVSRFAIFTPSTPVLRRDVPDMIRRSPLGLGGSGLDRAIEEMLRNDPEKFGPFDLVDVYELIDWADSLDAKTGPFADENIGNEGRAVRIRIGDRFMGNGHKSVSLLEASEGALYVLFMLALVGHEESPKLFAVDNFDQALHPRLARALTQLVSEQIVDDGSRQMLATTHNPLVLDGLDILDDRIRLFTVDRDKNGATQVNRVQVTPELMAQAENGFSLSRLWNMGRLGGVPKFL